MDTLSRASAVVTLVALAASHASASIVSTSGQATLIARPGDAQLHNLTGTNTYVWNEAQNVTVSSPVTIDASTPGFYGSSLSFAFSNIPLGTVVSSQFVHFDPPTSGTADGSITLDGDIVGVIAWNRTGFGHLDASDAMFGMGTVFSAGIDRRGVFDVGDGTGGGEDFFTISADRRTLSFHLQVTNPFDEVRVLTMVPAPSVGVVLAIAGMSGLRRRRG